MNSDMREPDLLVSVLSDQPGNPCAMVALVGRADIGDCAWVRWLLERQAAQGHGRLVVDLSRLSSMDWWAAMMLLWAARVVSRRGGLLVLASPQPVVARLLGAAGASKAVAVCDSLQQARGALTAGRPPSTIAESAGISHIIIS